MKKFSRICLVLLVVVAVFAGPSRAEIATLSQEMVLDIPCVSYNGAYYHLTLDYAGGLLWRYTSVTPMSGQPQFPATCASADQNLTITIPYLYYQGYELAVTMTYSPQASDPQGVYWQVSNYNLFPVYITAVTGGSNACFENFFQDPSQLQALSGYYQCVSSCGSTPNNPACQANCMSLLPASFAENLGTFHLSLQFANPTGSSQVFIVPAGAYFCPPNATVQPMMILQDRRFEVTVDPGKWYCLPSYCANLDADSPDEDDIYSICGLVKEPCMRAVVERVRGQQLTMEQKSQAQNDIWDCPVPH